MFYIIWPQRFLMISKQNRLNVCYFVVYFQIVAAAFIFIGVWVGLSYEKVENVADEKYMIFPVAILIGAGIFLFVLAVVGCIGAWKGHKCLLGCVSSGGNLLTNCRPGSPASRLHLAHGRVEKSHSIPKRKLTKLSSQQMS